MKANTNDIKEVRKVDDYAIEIETTAPFPILPDVLTTLAMIMSKKWCEENKADKPVDRRKGIENTASFKANGTGPFRLRERQPNVRTVFVTQPQLLGQASRATSQEVIFTPIGNDATRVAALLSGEIDVMEPVPVQDIERVKSSRLQRAAQAPSCAPSSSAWTRSATSCCTPASRARTRSRTSACARPSTRRSTSTASEARVMRGAAHADRADGRRRRPRLAAPT